MSTILISLHDAAQRHRLSSPLRKLHHHVLQAPDAHAGWALYQQESPDLVICDIGHAGADAFELSGAVRAASATVPLLVLTDGCDAQSALATRLGADLCLPLLVKVSPFLEAVASLLAWAA